MKKKPPKIAEKLLKLFLKEHLRDAHIGDFEEIYKDIYKNYGKICACLWYMFQILKSLPGVIFNSIFWGAAMFKNYFKVTIRNIKRQKIYSFINITGLATGMACCFVILLYIQNELSYDSYNRDADRIYRIITDVKSNIFDRTVPCCAYQLAPVIREKFPEVENTARLRNWGRTLIKIDDKFFREEKFILADQEILDILGINLISGNPVNVLKEPNSAIISGKLAEKIFGNKNVIGKFFQVKWNKNKVDLVVSGIMENLPFNSHLKTNIICSIRALELFYANTNRKEGVPSYEFWSSAGTCTYLKVSKDCDLDQLKENIQNEWDTQVKNYRERYGETFKIDFQALKDIYLNSSYLTSDVAEHGSKLNIFLFSSTALLIILVASFNFVILSTARSSVRSREIGIRKIMGAHRINLIKQILGESLIITVIALPAALLFVNFILPFFNHIIGKELSVNILTNLKFLSCILIITFVIGILSGGYIACYLSKFNPVKVLTKRRSLGTKSLLRKSLIVAQTVIFISLIIGSSIIYKQLRYTLNNEVLGYDKDFLISIRVNFSEFRPKYGTFKNEILKNPDVINVTSSVSGYHAASATITGVAKGELFQNTGINRIRDIGTDYDFLKTMGIKLLRGRNFSREFPSDKRGAVIFNETALKAIGINYPVEKELKTPWREETRTVIGVVKDFHYGSLVEKIEPLQIHLSSFLSQVIVRVRPENVSETLAFLETTWEKFSQDVFEYEFTDDALRNLYKSEQTLGQVISSSAFLAIFVACLGLFGLSLFMAERRTKEIAIRKAFGASVLKIFKLLSKEYIYIVMFSTIIAWPLSYYLANRWLENFAYRIKLGWAVFVIAGAMAFLIAMFTVSFQSLKAARANPVKSLRYE